MSEDKKHHILIVEDDPGIQAQFRHAMERAGFDTEVAKNYEEAITTIRQKQFDVAIIDVRLDKDDDKNADGLRILAQISKLENKPQAILATALWGKYPGLEEYAYAVWQKGQELGTLVMKVKEALEEKEKISSDRIRQSLHMIIAEMARKQLGLQEVCKLILDEMATLINAEAANLSLVQDNTLVVKATSSGEIGRRLYVEDSISGWAVRRQTTVYIPDLNADPHAKKLFKAGLGKNMQCELVVPLKIGVEPIGVLNFESPQKNAFTESEIKLIEELASQVAIAINSARLQDQTNTVRRLSEISGEINVIIHLGELEVARKALERLIEFMRCDKAAMFKYDPLNSKLDFLANIGLSKEYILDADLHENSARLKVVETKQPVIIIDIETDEAFASVRDLALREGYRAVIEMPLLVRDIVIGSIAAYYKNKHEFEQEEEALVKMFADHIATALNNAQQYQELEEARQRVRLATIGEISGDIVHRMNSPLGAIKTNVELLRIDHRNLTDSNPEINDILMDIHKIADDAITMVRQLRDRARQTVLEPVDIKEIMAATISEIEIPPTITLQNKISNLNLPNVRSNSNLGKVFRNLLTNGIDAMPPSRPGVLIIDANINEDKGMVELVIEDTGVGITDDFRDEIFNLLSVFSKKRADGGGHGLGLWYCRAFIEACGGFLPPPESVVGKGTKFTIYLPIME